MVSLCLRQRYLLPVQLDNLIGSSSKRDEAAAPLDCCVIKQWQLCLHL